MPGSGVFGLWQLVIMALSVWFGTTLESTRELYAGLALGCAASSAIAMLQHFGVSVVPRVSEFPAGLFVNSVQLGVVLAVLIVALVSQRMWLWALPLLPGLALSGSRGAWFALAVGLLGCAVRRTWVFAFALCAVVLFFNFVSLGPSDVQRLFIWSQAWSALTWLGWGPGVFYEVAARYDNHVIFLEYAHNDALQLAFEYGVMAVIPIGMLAFALWRTEASEWPVLLAFVTAGMYSMPLWMPVSSFIGLVCLGRVFRWYAVASDFGDYCRRLIISGERSDGQEAVSVPSHH